jgi:zinc D-Ala-D-Ala dipeptidase
MTAVAAGLRFATVPRTMTRRRSGRTLGYCLLFGLCCADTSRASQLPPGFVYLRDVAPDVLQDIRYAGLDNFTGRKVPGYDAPECILQRRVAEALARVQAALREQSLGLKVYDCYRPARATRAFLRWISDDSASAGDRRYYPRADKGTLHTQGYISPNSAHSRGIAVDLTLVRLPATAQDAFDPRARYGPCNGRADSRAPDNSLDMGTGFDCFDVMSQTNSAAVSGEQKEARALLRTTMRKHGFASYWREWWHFTFATEPGTALDFVIERPRNRP